MKTKLLIILTALFIAQICLASALIISDVKSNPSNVQPGEKVTLKLTIENNLDQDIEDIVITINATSSPTIPFAPYQSSNTDRIDEINEGDDEEISFDLITLPDANSGTYTIPITISYTLSEEGGDPISETSLVSIIINAKPKIEVSSEGSVLIKGTSGKILIKVINSGLGDARFLSVSLNSISGIQLTDSNKIYLGNIDSNDFDTADFNLFINQDVSSSINWPIEITYTDSRNNQITEEKIIPLKIYTEKEAISLGLIKKNNALVIVISILVPLILFLIYRKIRKNIRNKHKSQ